MITLRWVINRICGDQAPDSTANAETLFDKLRQLETRN
jgi:hypothetical protein